MTDHRLNIKIGDELYEWLRKYAFDSRKSMNEIIRELLEKEKNETNK